MNRDRECKKYVDKESIYTLKIISGNKAQSGSWKILDGIPTNSVCTLCHHRQGDNFVSSKLSAPLRHIIFHRCGPTFLITVVGKVSYCEMKNYFNNLIKTFPYSYLSLLGKWTFYIKVWYEGKLNTAQSYIIQNLIISFITRSIRKIES